MSGGVEKFHRFLLDNNFYGHGTLNQRNSSRFRRGALKFERLTRKVKARELFRNIGNEPGASCREVYAQPVFEVLSTVPPRPVDMRRYGEKEVIPPETFRELIRIS